MYHCIVCYMLVGFRICSLSFSVASICSFIYFHSMMLPVARVVYHRIVRWLKSSEFESMWKKVAVIHFRVLSRHSSGGNRKIIITSEQSRIQTSLSQIALRYCITSIQDTSHHHSQCVDHWRTYRKRVHNNMWLTTRWECLRRWGDTWKRSRSELHC
jgi:hypothetical protein